VALHDRAAGRPSRPGGSLVVDLARPGDELVIDADGHVTSPCRVWVGRRDSNLHLQFGALRSSPLENDDPDRHHLCVAADRPITSEGDACERIDPTGSATSRTCRWRVDALGPYALRAAAVVLHEVQSSRQAAAASSYAVQG